MRIKVIIASILLTLMPFTASCSAFMYDDVEPTADNIVFVGDSYCEGATLGTPDQGWAELTASYLGSENYIRSCKGGTGFSKKSGDDSFYQLVESAAKKAEDSNKIEWVVIMGGYNDYVVDDDTLISDGTKVVVRAKELFPQATILVGMNAWDGVRTDRQEQLDRVLLDIRAVAQSTGVTYIDHIEEVLYEHVELFTSDNVHPNTEGQEKIASHLTDFISDIVQKRETEAAKAKAAETANAYGNVAIWLILGTGLIIYLIYGVCHILAEKKAAK